MFRYALNQSRAVLGIFALFAGVALPAAAATNARVSESYGKLPLQFEANRGQTGKDVRFLARGAGYGLYLTASEAVLVLTKPDAKREAHSTQAPRDANAQVKSVALRMSLVGAARKPLVSGLDELPGKVNYFADKDPAKWRTNVPTYAKVRYQNVYPGIDLVYYGNQRQLEYDFIVAPGADPKKIVLGFKGADKLEIDAQGDLVLQTAGAAIRQHRPTIYQETDGVRREITGSYVRKGANRVGFKVAAYDRSRPLVIDPLVLSYSTLLGANGHEGGSGIAVDANGNAYVVGSTWGTDFPTTAGAFQTAKPSCTIPTPFVTKFNPTGSALVYSTYLGGCNDGGAAIAVDAAGNAYVTGTTHSGGFPTTPGAFQTTNSFGSAFVTKLNPTGSGLVYSTYLGGGSDDVGSGIAIDSTGNAYVTGRTASIDFPTTPGAFQPDSGGVGGEAAFVTKLNPEGSALVYSTYLTGGAGNGHDSGRGIAVDVDGNAYVVGSSSPFSGRPATFPTTAGAFQPTFGGGSEDVFVAKLDVTGSALIYSTYLGGSEDDEVFNIAVDAAGSAYVSGRTLSTDFPTTAGAFQTIYSGNTDAFVTKLNPAGSALVYSTFLGGNGFELAVGIAVDTEGNAYITGFTDSTNFPTTAGAFQTTIGGGTDAFVTRLNPTGSALVYSTYLGGSGGDGGDGIAVDSAGNAYVTGSAATNFPTTPGAFQTTHGGGSDRFGHPNADAFVTKFVDESPPPTPTSTRSEESAATAIGFWTNYGAETGSFSGGSIVASNVAASSAMFSFTGTAVSWIGVKCNVCGIATVSVDGGLPTTVNTAGPNAPGGLTSEPVFSASGLAGSNHTMVITVTGTSNTGGTYVAVDAFDVTAGSAASPLLPPVVLPPPPVVLPPLPPVVLPPLPPLGL